MSWLENAIGWVAPEVALRRARARAALTTVRNYEGARSTRRTQGWIAGSTGANSEIGSALISLRNRSRDLVRNNSYATSALDKLVSNSTGTGIVARWPKPAAQLWTDWAEDPGECDYYGELNFYGLQALAARTVHESGSVLIRKWPVRASANATVPVRIQLLEPDYIDTTKIGPMGNGNYAIYGVEVDPQGRRVAYWLWNQHPGETVLSMRGQSFMSQRVLASEVVQVFEKVRGRPGQVHGVPRLASALIKLRDLDEYEEAELVRKKIEACFTAFIKGPGRDLPISDNSKVDTTKSNLPRIESMSPGLIMYGSEEEDISFGAPQSSGGYGDYTASQLRAIAMAAGVTYEQLTGDLSRVNFSSMRGGRQEFRALVEIFRWLTFIPMACRPVAKWWLDAAYLSGKVRTVKHRPEWTPPRWEYIQPVDDVRAELLEIAGGLKTHSEALRGRGEDPEQFIEEKSAETKAFEKAGLKFDYGNGKVAAGVTVSDGTAEPGTPADKAPDAGTATE
jgi:lambda family phage portal protein